MHPPSGLNNEFNCFFSTSSIGEVSLTIACGILVSLNKPAMFTVKPSQPCTCVFLEFAGCNAFLSTYNSGEAWLNDECFSLLATIQ